jgi:hypothetical protein
LITVTAKQRLQREQNGPLIVDDQDALFFSAHALRSSLFEVGAEGKQKAPLAIRAVRPTGEQPS